MPSHTMVAATAWIERGVAKQRPDKVAVEREELMQLIQGGKEETTDNASDTDNDVAPNAQQPAAGLRGSAPASDDEDGEKVGGDDDDDKMRSMLRGIACHATPMDDPYITAHHHSDDEEEKEDFELRPDDNLLAVAKINKEDYTLEVHVFNEAEDDFYCHHDYILEAPPLCLEPIGYDPGADSRKGNLLAVGTMQSAICIWDLDLVNAVEPVVTLASAEAKARKKKKTLKKGGAKKAAAEAMDVDESGESSSSGRRKRDGTAQGHSDAVLCVRWNALMPHVLASGSADKSVILWDLDEVKAASVYGGRDKEIQSIAWHRKEAGLLALGTLGGSVQVLDCRESGDTVTAAWNTGSPIENVLWVDDNLMLVSSEDGHIRLVDVRHSAKFALDTKAHDAAVGGLALKGEMLVSASEDETVAVWRLSSGGLERVHTQQLGLGGLHSLAFCPDSSSRLCVGGEAGSLLELIDVRKWPEVEEAFFG